MMLLKDFCFDAQQTASVVEPTADATVKVFGEKDADGFYWGEAGTRSGFVPCNMVSEVQVKYAGPVNPKGWRGLVFTLGTFRRLNGGPN